MIHCFIFSLGSRCDKYIYLNENICGYKDLPQTVVLPLVDVVITHEGNKTVCEIIAFR